MLSLQGESFGCCDGVSRRSVLRAGVLGLSGLGLADLLRAKAEAGTQSNSASELSVILVWLDGGPPQHETYDPKPDAPSEFRGPLKAISTAVPGIQVSELLPEHARQMDKMSLIRSVHHNNEDHFAAAHWMLTGYLGSNAVNMAPMYPSAASIITKLKGAKRSGMPAYVGLPTTHSVGIRPGYHGGAYLGGAFGPFMADGDPNNPGYKVRELTLPGGLDAVRLDNRKCLLSAIDSARHSIETEMDDVDRFSREAFAMLTGPEARRAFDLSKEDPRLRDRYGRHQWGQSALLARRLVGAGVRFVTLTFGGWDFHANLDKGMHSVLPILDKAVGTLVDDLDRHGQLDSTIVMVMGEFGRTPRINKGLPGVDPNPGRDHWGRVMSVLMAGGGLRQGITVGASNSRGEVPRERPVTPAEIVATLYARLGIDPTMSFMDKVNRPIMVVPSGTEPIRELL
jgi:hypothetical protein